MKKMRGSYEHYLLGQGLPIQMIQDEMTPDVKIVSATKDEVPYPLEKTLKEVCLRSSSKGYRKQLKRDYEGRRGYALLDSIKYVLHTNTNRMITVLHRSDNGKFYIDDDLFSHPKPFPRWLYKILDQLLHRDRDGISDRQI
ncbi:MAG: hypothetical protein DRH24_08525 [Deltaproteobacteria bacterium]|nr:MAG: hypothetical protein DRH24_08525 [Deltaproteobacteria bacterium]